MLEILVDPEVSSILLELENGSKESSYLTEKLQINDNEIQKNYPISYNTDLLK